MTIGWYANDIGRDWGRVRFDVPVDMLQVILERIFSQIWWNNKCELIRGNECDIDAITMVTASDVTSEASLTCLCGEKMMQSNFTGFTLFSIKSLIAKND